MVLLIILLLGLYIVMAIGGLLLMAVYVSPTPPSSASNRSEKEIPQVSS